MMLIGININLNQWLNIPLHPPPPICFSIDLVLYIYANDMATVKVG